jgi:hypothetical protein
MGLIASAAVSAVGAGVSAYVQDNAQHEAANAQLKALDNLKYLDVQDLVKQAKNQDLSKYQSQFAAQEKYDPLFAEMRTQGAKNIIQQLNADTSGTTAGDKALADLGTSTDLSNKQNAPVIQGLIDQAKQDLAAGASMPPEFEGQLIKAGLETAGASGGVAGLNGSGATGSNSRRLLGMEGIQLQQSRATEAQNLAGTAAGLQTERQSALSNLLSLDNNLRAAKFTRAQGGVAIGSSSIPSIGLTGGDVVNMDNANTNLRNQVTLGQGALNAQKKLADGQMWSQIIGAGTSLVSGMVGGGAGGGGGGMGGMLGGMMGGSGGGSGGGGGSAMTTNYGGMMSSGGNSSWIGSLFSNRGNMTQASPTSAYVDPYGFSYQQRGGLLYSGQ